MKTQLWPMVLLAVICAGFAPPQARAQEAPPQSLSAPGEEHRRLDVLAGDWDVVVRFPAGPGKEMEGKSSCVAKWVMDGRFMRQEYTSMFMGKPLSVVRYLGFDRHRGKFVTVQFESTHTDVMNCEGSVSPDGKTFSCTGRHIDAATGKDVEVRAVTTVLSPDAFTHEMRYIDGEQSKVVTLTHARRAAP